MEFKKYGKIHNTYDKKLLNNFTCERVGLILFSGSTFAQCPLTKDFDAFILFLDQIRRSEERLEKSEKMRFKYFKALSYFQPSRIIKKPTLPLKPKYPKTLSPRTANIKNIIKYFHP